MCISDDQAKEILVSLKELKILNETLDIRVSNLEQKKHEQIMEEIMEIKESLAEVKKQ